jgi:septal ring factor EnvC (AmiA/AmiB activator)
MVAAVGPRAISSSGGVAGVGSFDDVIRFMREERQHMEAKMEQQQQELKHERAAMEAKLKKQCLEIEQLREQAKPELARDTISEQQLQALQARLEALHEARLLTEEELDSLEDTIVDCIEVLPTAFATGNAAVEKVLKMVLVSEKVASDRTLARQLKRKKFA